MTFIIRERTERPATTDNYQRSERVEGSGFGQRDSGPREGGFGRGRGGGRGRGPRGTRGDRGGRGGFGGKREFERHSGSDKTYVFCFCCIPLAQRLEKCMQFFKY